MATFIMPFVLAVTIVFPSIVLGTMNDEILGLAQLVLLLGPLLTILPLSVGGGLNALALRYLARNGETRRGIVLLLGLCTGVLWGLLFYCVSTPSHRWQSESGWLVQLQVSSIITYTWHGWRMSAYIERAKNTRRAPQN